MNNNFGVTLADYEMGFGTQPGQMSSMALDELKKAMSAGALTGRDLAGQNTTGSALKVESLENTLKILTFSENDMFVWKKIPKLPAYNTVEEYNKQTSYGSEGYSFNDEGEVPQEDDANFVRDSQLVKFMGVKKSVTHPMQLVKLMGGESAMELAIKAGTMKILRDADEAIVFGDSSLITQQFNGLFKQHLSAFADLTAWQNSSSVVDLRGQVLTEASLEDASLSILENHGDGDLLVGPPVVLSNFVKRFHDSKLIQPNTPGLTDATMGQKVNKFQSQFGEIGLGWDKFMKKSNAKTLASLATHASAPTIPTADATTPKAATTDVTNLFTGFTGDYRYAVSAFNKYGESALANLSTAGSPNAKLTIGAGQSAELKWAAGAGGVAATGYIIWRSVKNTSASTAALDQFYPIFKISVAQLAAGFDGGAAGLVWDKNRFIEKTEKCFLIENQDQIWSFKQLAPLMKMDLAVVAPSNQFMVLLYGTPILYAPLKMVEIINVGTSLS